MRLRALAIASCAVALAACGPEAGSTRPDGGHGGTHADGGDGGDEVIILSDASVITHLDAGYEGPAIVYGESKDTLYMLDPNTKAASVVGTFSGCSSVIDLALDKDSNIYATTSGGLWTVNATTAACTHVASGTYPNSLSFVPAGTLDPNVEALVGYQGAKYIRIDPSTGAITTVGTGLTGGYTSSGDIVSVKGGGTYLTVKGPSCSDCLFQVDPKTGDRIKDFGSIGYTDVFGIAYWAGRIYGFTNGGDLFEIQLTGGVLKTVKITVPNAPAGLSFWGAGSTTSAPVGPQ